ncbi:imidazole glycerol phosphate synthase hisHF [Salpingoeca rosetta]|uniref:Imidazole glycerol phosphate synthase hisHF n=1 Tax=Salpingoeca rosetta (strain ATCC 50818 / BSB-021) TaxID=946362 RepID=F2U8R3_SALR5|nr:imidazole glycerol phosphate synthase hisHF [Salpingoeca rosetta]EGD72771.1 imidazole glycerol phosphate synthase hisHF [Salpingoeca rosetta]|eukprot:XP_004994594.1 imidazole glycerol phosphate synthase hisHF [Salpingoeca rosetta]
MSTGGQQLGGGGVYLLDYGAGNVRSVCNAVAVAGVSLNFIRSADDFDKADKLIFPGVGSFGACMHRLEELGYIEPLRAFIASGRPYLGICLGMQTLFKGSEESPGIEGLGVIDSTISRFQVPDHLAVPHMGWNGVNPRQSSKVLEEAGASSKFYFVHSFLALPTRGTAAWALTTTNYGIEFVSSVCKGNVLATQFHPEKSGQAGLRLIKQFLLQDSPSEAGSADMVVTPNPPPTNLAPRLIACLDVRTNDHGDLVVTKGDQYDVREKDSRNVRNLGKPVDLAARYYTDGADEVTFLNITSFRDSPLRDQPMLEVLRKTSERVFVPLTIGGGIRDVTDPDGTPHTALEVASEYFRSGADKVSIGSDAVLITEQFLRTGVKTGKSSIEQISHVYGAQAVVISVDPRRVYVASPDDTKHHTIKTQVPGPNGEAYCWYQCTIKGGREPRDIDAYELARTCEELGAGEILLNCMDKDGTNSGYDLELIADIVDAVSIPVIASSGAGKVEHFSACLRTAKPAAVLAAGIFHREEVPIQQVKQHLSECGFETRPVE